VVIVAGRLSLARPLQALKCGSSAGAGAHGCLVTRGAWRGGPPWPAGRERQFERLYLLLVDANQFEPTATCYHVAHPPTTVSLEQAMTESATSTSTRGSSSKQSIRSVARWGI
jgi:hypothetical protein